MRPIPKNINRETYVYYGECVPTKLSSIKYTGNRSTITHSIRVPDYKRGDGVRKNKLFRDVYWPENVKEGYETLFYTVCDEGDSLPPPGEDYMEKLTEKLKAYIGREYYIKIVLRINKFGHFMKRGYRPYISRKPNLKYISDEKDFINNFKPDRRFVYCDLTDPEQTPWKFRKRHYRDWLVKRHQRS